MDAFTKPSFWIFFIVVGGLVFLIQYLVYTKVDNIKTWQEKELSKPLPFFIILSKMQPPEPLEEGENLIALVDFSFFQGNSQALKIIYLTNKRIFLVRYALFLRTKVVFKSIPLSEIKSIKVAGNLVVIGLKSGEVFEIVLNQRLVNERDQAYRTMMEFFKQMSN